MIRDLQFDELQRASQRRRLVRLTAASLVISTVVTVGVFRELKIRKEYAALPEARIGDLEALKARHAGISAMLDEHHVWVGAYKARAEVDDLVVSIHEQETAVASLEAKRKEEETRIREEAEAARNRGLVLAQRQDFGAALEQFRRALELCDSLGEDGWNGEPWEHRDAVVRDVFALENLEREGR